MSDIPFTLFNQAAYKFVQRLDDTLMDNQDTYIQLAGPSYSPNNLVKRLKFKSHRRVVIALLQATTFGDIDFSFCNIPDIQRIALYYYSLNARRLPESIELSVDIRETDFSATQKAILNMNTFELTYTMYTVRPQGCYHPLTGKGQLPMNDFDEFDYSRYTPC